MTQYLKPLSSISAINEFVSPVMKRTLKITADGSHTFHVSDIDESYHSLHGAIQESLHVFIKEGFLFHPGSELRILETGFGTGLNAALTLMETKKTGKKVRYDSIELYPLTATEYNQLNYFEKGDKSSENFIRLHECKWNIPVDISPLFSIMKLQYDLVNCELPGKYDLVYFDAFSPRAQPELWKTEVFRKIYNAMTCGGVLVTYCSSGKVRRNMEESGFLVQKIPGPPGKREMIRGIKNV